MTPAQPDLFKDYRYGLHKQPVQTADVCARKHHGNANSTAANVKASSHKHNDRATILRLIRESKDGMTLKELCSAMKRLPNEISGRLTELKTGRFKDGLILIYVQGTRDGCGVHYSY